MSHLINVMFLDVNESVSRIDDFWLTTNVNSTARTTHENFINNTNNNNQVDDTCHHTYWRPSDSLRKILRSLYETIMHNIRAFHVHVVQNYYIRIRLNG